MDYDVVVVGAGLAGLRCAERVAAAGRTVAVLEAGDVVGGRQRTDAVDGFLLAGVLAEEGGDASDTFVRLLVRMFALGLPGVPARGIRALPEQLAARVRRLGGDVRVGEPVATVASSSVVTAAGDRVRAAAVVVAVGPDAVAGLLPVPRPATKGLRTWWFAAPTTPTRSAMLVVDGRRRGPVVNTAVVSNAAPTYAPAGRHLVQVTCLLEREAASPASEADVRRQAGEMYGVSAAPWELVRRDDVVDALPVQPPPLRTRSGARTATGAFVCGDHRDTASIQGALVSGDRVATAVLASLTGVSPPRKVGRREPMGPGERQERG